VSQRSLLFALFVSLAVNLFVLGALAGVYLFGPRLHHRPPDFRGGGPAMMAAAATLPDDQRAAYHEALRAEAMRVGPQLHEARQIRRGAWAKLAADPVDAGAITTDLDRSRALETQARAEIDRAILGFAVKLPAAERARLGQALAEPPRHGGRHGPPPPPPVP
jgi:uncharacterized membrane protein